MKLQIIRQICTEYDFKDGMDIAPLEKQKIKSVPEPFGSGTSNYILIWISRTEDFN